MPTYGSFRPEEEIGTGPEPGIKWFRASHQSSEETGLLKVVTASPSKVDDYLESFRLERDLGEDKRSGWLRVLELGPCEGGCYAVYSDSQPQLANDISNMIPVSSDKAGSIALGIIESLIRLRAKGEGRSHGNLKPDSVRYIPRGGRIDYSRPLLLDLAPAGASSRKSDFHALGLLLYEIISHDSMVRINKRTTIPDGKLWGEYTEEKRDSEWRALIQKLMEGRFDGRPIEDVRKEFRKLVQGMKPTLVKSAIGVAVVGAGVTAIVLWSKHHSGSIPVFQALQAQFANQAELGKEPALKEAFGNSKDEAEFEERISQWWTNAGASGTNLAADKRDFPGSNLLNTAIANDLGLDGKPVFRTNDLLTALSKHLRHAGMISEKIPEVYKQWGALRNQMAFQARDIGPTGSDYVIQIMQKAFEDSLKRRSELSVGVDNFASAFEAGASDFFKVLETDFRLPAKWLELPTCQQARAVDTLQKMAAGTDARSYQDWKLEVENLPRSVDLGALVTGWPPDLAPAKTSLDPLAAKSLPQVLSARREQLLTDIVKSTQEISSLVDQAEIPCADVNNLTSRASNMVASCNGIAKDGNMLVEEVRKWEAANVEMTRLSDKLNQRLEEGDYDNISEAEYASGGATFTARLQQAAKEKQTLAQVLRTFDEGKYANYDFLHEADGIASKPKVKGKLQPVLDESNLWDQAVTLKSRSDAIGVSRLLSGQNEKTRSKQPMSVLLTWAASDIAANQQKAIEQKAAEEKDLTDVRAGFNAGKYDEASSICARHPGDPEFDSLAKSIGDEAAKLTAAQRQLSVAKGKSPNGDYSFLDLLQLYRNNGKEPWRSFFDDADKAKREQDAASIKPPPVTYVTVKTIGAPADEGADLFLDGIKVGQLGDIIPNLEPGKTYSLSISKTGFESVTNSVTTRADDKSLPVTFQAMKPIPGQPTTGDEENALKWFEYGVNVTHENPHVKYGNTESYQFPDLDYQVKGNLEKIVQGYIDSSKNYKARWIKVMDRLKRL